MNLPDLTPASGVEIHAAEMHGNDAALLPDADPSAMPSALMRDAGRYRWLRSRDLDAIRDGGIFAGQTPQNVVLNGVDLDHAIDAAMRLEAPIKAQTTAEIAADLRGKLRDIACLPAGADCAVAVLWARQAFALVDSLLSSTPVAASQAADLATKTCADAQSKPDQMLQPTAMAALEADVAALRVLLARNLVFDFGSANDALDHLGGWDAINKIVGDHVAVDTEDHP